MAESEKRAQHSPSRLIVAEDLEWHPNDPIPSVPQQAVVFEGTLYLWAHSRVSAQWMETLIRTVDLAYPPALIYGFEVGITGKLLSDAEVLKTLQNGGGAAAAQLKLIVVGAYDGESFLVWRRRGA